MNTHRKTKRAIATATLSVFVLQLFAAFPAHATLLTDSVGSFKIAADLSRRSSQELAVKQAAAIITNIISNAVDTDGDPFPEPPGFAAGAGPTGGGLVPATLGAPIDDGYGGKLGYCAWDNGTDFTSGANRLKGSNTDLGAVTFAVVSAGLNGKFERTCAEIASNAVTTDDDYVVRMSTNQIRQGLSGTVFFGDPVGTTAILSTLLPADQKDGQLRLVKSDNTLWRFDQAAGAYVPASASPFWSAGSNPGQATTASGISQIGIGTTNPGYALEVNSAAIPLGLRSSGQYNGVNFLNGAALSGFVGYDNAASRLYLNGSTGSTIDFAIGGTTQLQVAANGRVTALNGITANNGVTVASGVLSAANVALTGGSINGTAIGNVTPSTGAFTTLSGTLSGNVNGNATTASKLQTPVSISMSGDVNWSVSFDGSTNVSAAGTLSNTGVTDGAYGSATTSPAFSVDSRGRIVAATNTLITPAFSSITGTPTTATGYGILVIDGVPIGATTPASGAFTSLNVNAGLNAAGGNLVLGSAGISNVLAARPAAGIANRIFIATDTNEIYRDTGAGWSKIGYGAATASTALSGLGVAVANNTLANGAFAQAWNWSLSGNSSAFAIGESIASSGGTGAQYLFTAGTLAGSTAIPFAVSTRGVEAFRVDSVNPQIVANVGTAAAPTYSFAGNEGTGFYSPAAGQLGASLAGTRSMLITAGSAGIGKSALALDTSATATALGTNALAANTTGAGNTAVGMSALAANIGGGQNTAIGYQALVSNGTGGAPGNTAVGYRASAGYNASNGGTTAIGAYALENSNSSRNTAVGFAAMQYGSGQYNVAMGISALQSGTGGDNTAIGGEALASTTSGGGNVAVGRQAGYASFVAFGGDTTNRNITGARNTFLGSFAMPGTTTQLNYASALGSDSRVTTSNTIALGRTIDTTVIGATGISTTGKLNGALLQVTGNIGATGAVNAATFAGDGAALTNLNASNIATGTLAVANGGTGATTAAGARTSLGAAASGANSDITSLSGLTTALSVAQGGTGVTTSTGTGSVVLSASPTLTGTLTAGDIVGGNLQVNSSRGASSQGAYLQWNRDNLSGRTYLMNQKGLANPGGGGFVFGEVTTGNVFTERMRLSEDGNLTIGGTLSVAGAVVSNLEFTSGNYARFGHANQSDANDGKIGANLFTEGLNIVGTQTVAAAGRKIAIYGTVNAQNDMNVAGFVRAGNGTLAAPSFAFGSETGTGFYRPGTGVLAASVAGTLAMRVENSAGNTFNTSLGAGSLGAISTGDRNTALGYASLSSNTAGTQNIAVGVDALQFNTTGSLNTALGRNALNKNVTGGNNSAGGTSALLNNIASFNTAFGEAALYANTSGASNVALGRGAGYFTLGGVTTNANTTGTGNTFIGAHAMPGTTVQLTGATVIGYDAQITSSNTVVLGRSSDTTVIGATGDDGSGNKLQVTGGIKATGGFTGTTANFSGAVSSQRIDFSTANVIVGSGAIAGAQSGVGRNTAVGSNALLSNSSGANNTAVGYYSSLNQTTAFANSAFGVYALFTNVSSAFNSAFGSQALQNSTGGSNTALGQVAGFDTTTGSGNAFVGAGAGRTNTTGSNNSALGASAQPSSGALTYATAIGSDSRVSSSDTIALGRTTDKTVIGATGTDGSTYNLQVTGGIKAISGGMNVAAGDLILGSATVTGTFATRPAAGVANRVYVASDTKEIYRDNGTTWDRIATGSTSGISGLTNGAYLIGGVFDGSAPITWAVDATSANTGGKIVARDASGNFGAGVITATSFAGNGAALTNLNASNIATGTLAVANGGTGNTATPTNGQLLIGTGTGYALATLTGGTGINVSNSAGGITLSNTGVTSFNTRSGAVTLTLADVNGVTNFGTTSTTLGVGALPTSATGTFNTAVGYQALSSTTTGSQNAAVGNAALGGVTSGSLNAALGYRALASANSDSNVAVGGYAMENVSGTNNVGIGRDAMKNGSGNNNTAVGSGALNGQSTGARNVALGVSAGYADNSGVSTNANTSGTNNTFLGTYARPGTTTQLTYATALGSDALVTTASTITLGRTSDTTVIGASGTLASSPNSARLQVTGNANIVQNAAASPGLVVTGKGMDAGSPTDNAAGVFVGLGYNAPSNRQLWIGATDNIGSATSSIFRYGTGATIANIDGVSGNGATRLPINLGTDTSSVAVGGGGLAYNATLPGKLAVYSEAAGKGLVVRGAAAQTGNLLELQNNAATSLFSVTSSGATTATSYTGNGAALTNLNASNINSGTLAVVNGGTGTTTSTGTGSVVLNASPTFTGTITGNADVEMTSGQYLRFGHANQADTNDGKIGAGLFSNGLNIVGTQTVAAGGRLTTIYGNVNALNDLNVTGNQSVSGTLNPLGGIVVQNGQNGGPGRGLYMWNANDSRFGSYMTAPGAAKSLAGAAAVASLDGRTDYAIRQRIEDFPGNTFIWENSSEKALMSLNGAYGSLFVSGNFSAASNISATGTLSGKQLYLNDGAGITYQNLIVSDVAMANSQAGGFGANTVFGGRALYYNTSGAKNVAVGGNALQANSTGGQNVAVGLSALSSNTTGIDNVAIGTAAMSNGMFGSFNPAVNTGSNNLAMGTGALYVNTTGSNNQALGHNSLQANTTGQDNATLGSYTLYDNTTGSYNVAVGLNGGRFNTTGSYNVALGHSAGTTNTIGTNNTAIGYGANTASNALTYATALGSGAIVSTANTVALGRTTDTVVVGATGTTFGGGKLQVTGTGISNYSGAVGSNASYTLGRTGNEATLAVAAANAQYSTNAVAGDVILRTEALGANLIFVNGANPAELSIVNNNVTVANALTASAGIKTNNGSAAAPSYTFGNQITTGFYLPAGGELGASLVGVRGMWISAGSVAVGKGALASDTSATATAFGTSALAANTTAVNNSAFGFEAMKANTSAVDVTAVGYRALWTNTTGSANVAVGSAALMNSTTGGYNIAIGSTAMSSNTTGAANTAIGDGVLSGNTTGFSNVAVGAGAGFTAFGGVSTNKNISGSNNTFIGTNALPGTTTQLNYATVIGSDAVVTTANTIVLGRALEKTVIGATGTDGSANNLQVTGGIKALTGGIASTSFVSALRIDVSAPAGVTYSNTIIGTTALPLTQSGLGANTAVGESALSANTSGAYNVALGSSTLRSNTTGTDNTAVGINVLYTNTNGTKNVALGNNSLYGNTTGTNNIAAGFSALGNNAGGSSNVSIGTYSMYSNTAGNTNTAVGDYSLYFNTGTSNTATGSNALLSNTSGGSNTAVGKNALYSTGTSSNNSALGGGAGYTSTTLTAGNSTFIGNGASIADNAIMAGTGRITLLGANASASGLGAAVPNAYMTAIGSGAAVSTVNTVALGRTNDKTVIGATGDDGSAYNLQVTGGIKAVTGGVNVAGGDLVLGSTNVSGTLAARPAFGVANRVYIATDTNEIYRDTGAAWTRIASGTPTSALSGIVAATANNTIANGAFSQAWNWAQTANTTAFALGESAAATGGTGTQYLAKIGTLAASTAIPFSVSTRGTEVFRVDSINPQLLANNGTANIPTYSFAGQTSTGFYLPATNELGASVAGSKSLWLSSGRESTALGIGSLAVATSTGNTGVGKLALNATTTGTSNTALGGYSAYRLTTGSSNTAVGYASLSYLTTGGANTALGWFAGDTTTNPITSNSSVFIGTSASIADTANMAASGRITLIGANTSASGLGAANAAANMTAIGYGASVTTANTVVLGTTADKTVIGATGTDGSAYNLQVTGGIKAVNGGVSIAAGDLVLGSTNVSGTLAARPAFGVANRVYIATDTNEIYRDTGTAWARVATGAPTPALSAIVAATANNTIANGAFAQTWNWAQTGNTTAFALGESVAATGGTGTQYLHTIGTLAASTAIPLSVSTRGTEAFRVDSVNPQIVVNSGTAGAPGYAFAGAQNTGFYRTSGGDLAAVVAGNQLMRLSTANNLSVGLNAMSSITTGIDNVAFGAQALTTNATGTFNTALGTYSLRYTTSSRNTAVGFSSVPYATGDGNTGVGTEVLFNTTGGASNTALGHRAGYATAGGITTNANTTGSNNTFLGANAMPGTTTQLTYATALGSEALVTTSNTIILGRTTDSVAIGQTGVGAYKFTVNGTAGGTSAYAVSSDRRFKTNITPVINAVNTIKSLEGVHYEFNRAAFPEKDFETGRQLGFIAQQIENFVPEVVRTDRFGFKSVQYSQLVPLLVEGIKEQQQVLRHLLKKDPTTLLVDIKTFQGSDAVFENIKSTNIKTANLEAETARIKKLDADRIDAKLVRSDVMKTGEVELFVGMGSFQPIFNPEQNSQYIVNATAEDGSSAFASVAYMSGRVTVTPISGKGVDISAIGTQVGLVAASKKIKATWIRMS